MLRELSKLLDELHDGLNGIQAHHGVRLANVDMTLPLDLRPVFRNGGCVLLADVPRSSGIDAWIASPSKLTIGWSAAGAFIGDDRSSGAPASYRHPRAGRDPVAVVTAASSHASVEAESLDPRLRGDDELDGTSVAHRPRGNRGSRSPGGAEGETRDLSRGNGPGFRSAPPGLRGVGADAEAAP